VIKDSPARNRRQFRDPDIFFRQTRIQIVEDSPPRPAIIDCS